MTDYDAHPSASRPSSRGRYSFALLFGFVTFTAILSAVLRMALRSEPGTPYLAATIATTAVAAILGIVVGAHQSNRRQGILVGLIVGLLCGVAVGPSVVIPRQHFGALLALQFAGAGLIGVTAWLFERPTAPPS